MGGDAPRFLDGVAPNESEGYCDQPRDHRDHAGDDGSSHGPPTGNALEPADELGDRTPAKQEQHSYLNDHRECEREIQGATVGTVPGNDRSSGEGGLLIRLSRNVTSGVRTDAGVRDTNGDESRGRARQDQSYEDRARHLLCAATTPERGYPAELVRELVEGRQIVALGIELPPSRLLAAARGERERDYPAGRARALRRIPRRSPNAVGSKRMPRSLRFAMTASAERNPRYAPTGATEMNALCPGCGPRSFPHDGNLPPVHPVGFDARLAGDRFDAPALAEQGLDLLDRQLALDLCGLCGRFRHVVLGFVRGHGPSALGPCGMGLLERLDESFVDRDAEGTRRRRRTPREQKRRSVGS